MPCGIFSSLPYVSTQMNVIEEDSPFVCPPYARARVLISYAPRCKAYHIA